MTTLVEHVPVLLAVACRISFGPVTEPGVEVMVRDLNGLRRIDPAIRGVLAILDVVLPEMNGIELAILLTRDLPNCRILLFSGQALTCDLLADVEKKGYSFALVAKPIHPLLLLERASEALTGNKENQPERRKSS